MRRSICDQLNQRRYLKLGPRRRHLAVVAKENPTARLLKQRPVLGYFLLHWRSYLYMGLVQYNDTQVHHESSKKTRHECCGSRQNDGARLCIAKHFASVMDLRRNRSFPHVRRASCTLCTIGLLQDSCLSLRTNSSI